MSVRCRIDHNPVTPLRFCPGHCIHKITFVIGLEKGQFHPQFLCNNPQVCLDAFQRDTPVNFHFPAAQQLQVGTIDD
jgi:hypothetical protein